jgi:hypothetical protein
MSHYQFPAEITFGKTTLNQLITKVKNCIKDNDPQAATHILEIIRQHLKHLSLLNEPLVATSLSMLTKVLITRAAETSTADLHALLDLNLTRDDLDLYRLPEGQLTKRQTRHNHIARLLRAIIIYHASHNYPPAQELLWRIYKCKVYNPFYEPPDPDPTLTKTPSQQEMLRLTVKQTIPNN